MGAEHPIPDRLRQVFERMNLTPEEQAATWRATWERQNQKHRLDEEYRAWLEDRDLVDERYPSIEAAASLGVEYADLATTPPSHAAIARLSRAFVIEHHVFPVRIEEGALHLAMVDPRDARLVRAVEKIVNLRVVPMLASPQGIDYRLGKHYRLEA